MEKTYNGGKRSWPPKVGDDSPWDTIDNVYEVGPGACFVTTPGHGGIILEDSFQEKMPKMVSDFGEEWAHGYGVGYYEEDCAAQLPPLYVPDAFNDDELEVFRKDAKSIIEKFKMDMYGNMNLPEPVLK